MVGAGHGGVAVRMDLVEHSLREGEALLAQRTEDCRKKRGQFLTPASVARFMAKQLGPLRDGDRVLDPGSGSGTLACAVIERAIQEGGPAHLWIDGFEHDPQMGQVGIEVLQRASKIAEAHGITVRAQIRLEDYLVHSAPIARQPSLFHVDDSSGQRILYDHIIANPPYFKLSRDDERIRLLYGQVKGHTNIYTLFMSLAMRILELTGRACFIVPRSFCSGAYFGAFRRDLLTQVVPLSVHLFDSRQDTFSSVLQENIIITFRRRQPDEDLDQASLLVSISANGSGMEGGLVTRKISLRHFLFESGGVLFFRLPMGELDEQIIDALQGWDGSLKKYGYEVSTGPVVSFRARSLLSDSASVMGGVAVPLLLIHNVKPGRVVWPICNLRKPQGILLGDGATSLLVPARNYVLLRRFSAKEEPRRLVAAPFLAQQQGHTLLGLENHLNYVYKRRGEFEIEEVLGLAALYNSAIYDRYFRIANGNTQVNAEELRSLPLPSLDVIKRIGTQCSANGGSICVEDVDDLVFSALRHAECLSSDFPTFKETRFIMGKIQQAQEILKSLGLPPAQQNEMSALTLLVLAQLSEGVPWSQASPVNMRIHDMLLKIKEHYGREYAENTRETIRRQVIHQFQQAGLVVRNPEDLDLPTNSPRTHYALSDAMVQILRSYGTDKWDALVQSFIEKQGTLIDIYRGVRGRHTVPLRLPNGREYHLSPGEHNQLQALVIEEFGPRFAPGARLLYLGDTENKTLIIDEGGFQRLGIPVPSHSKLPDIILLDEEKHWLFLIEVVTSHGPVSPKRRLELEEVFQSGSAERIYVTAFPDFSAFKAFLAEIAWETEVWLAEMPGHLIHFNGERFLGPRA